MSQWARLGRGLRASWLVAAAIAASTNAAFAERLAIRTYTVADGLPSDAVTCARRDSSGFLWVCTEAGLARFDGETFTSYGPDRGLPSAIVRDLLEARDGTYWVGTTRGLAHFDPRVSLETSAAASPAFHVYAPPRASGRIDSDWDVRALLEEADGTLWLGAADGLYRRRRAVANDRSADAWVLELVVRDANVWTLAIDRDGTLWAGTITGLLRRTREGAFRSFTAQAILGHSESEDLLSTTVRVVLPTADGRVWIALPRHGICRLDVSTDRPRAEICYTRESGLPDDIIRGLSQATDGSLWAATNHGPVQLLAPFDGSRETLRRFDRHEGLDLRLFAIATDQDDNIWLPTANLGLVRIFGAEFTQYGDRDGLIQEGPPGLLLDRTGALYHVFDDRLSRFENGRFVSKQLPVSRDSRRFNYEWGWTQIAAQDEEGRWWTATDDGAYRYPAGMFRQVAARTPDLVIDRTSGLSANHVSLVFVDSLDRVWLCVAATEADERNACVHRDPSTGAIVPVDWSPTGVGNAVATAITEDTHGQVWIGLSNGGLIRYDASGTIAGFGPADGLPGRAIRGLHVDRRGRLWLGATHGALTRLDEVAAVHPRVVTYTRRDGLTSDSVYAIAEDRFGRIYFGTTLGLDQLDPDSGHLRHFTARDGIGAGTVYAVIADATGAIWFATARAMTRFVPRPDPSTLASPIRLARIRVNGRPIPLSDLGARQIEGLQLGPDENGVQIDFAAVSLAAGEPIRYQHRLVGADSAWSEASWDRTIAYARLAPGHYRFEVRPVSSAGASGTSMAMASFTILPPVWQRWWFLLAAGGLAVLAVYSLHHERLRRVVAVERMRMRIATDLHDDIGGTLSRIAILSEVVKRQPGLAPEAQRRLDDLGETARGLVDAASDVVWSVDPRRDDVASVLQRLRDHASDVLDGTSVTFTTPAAPDAIRLSPDQRRHLYLILKEALTNISRHADARHAMLSVTTDGQRLRCEVRDDGRGFEPSVRRGNGLGNMRSRAIAIGGRLEVRSGTDGTVVQMEVLLARRRPDLRAAVAALRAWLTSMLRPVSRTADQLIAHEVEHRGQKSSGAQQEEVNVTASVTTTKL